jgi:hypothetical protein
MPWILPGNPGVLFEFDFTDRFPARAWFTTPPPRAVDVAAIVRASYASNVGRTLAGIGLILGVPLGLIGLAGMSRDPWNVVTATAGAAFAAIFVAVPAVPAIRLGRALRHGVLAQATVTHDAAAKDPRRRGLGLRDEAGRDIPYDPALTWTRRLRAGMAIDVLVDPARERVLWILGPAESEPAGTDERAGSDTMPGR